MNRYEEIEKLIKHGVFDEAQQLLDEIDGHDAQWHFTRAQLYVKRRWYGESKKELEIAVQLDPENKNYRKALEKLERRAKAEKGSAAPSGDEFAEGLCRVGCDACDLCGSGF